MHIKLFFSKLVYLIHRGYSWVVGSRRGTEWGNEKEGEEDFG